MDEIEQVLRHALTDRYVIDREIGRGGMAVVFKAEDVKLGRPVAIKALRSRSTDPVATARFLQEIRTVATLSHPNILPLHDSGEADGVLYFVSPFVAGESLRARLERDLRLRPEEAVHLAATLARALQYAHQRGIIHRDVKPENILLQEGEPLLADFGIAYPLPRGGAGSDRITGADLRLGTPSYMSPEQVAGGDVDHRSDLYSLGIVLYEMLGGRPPFIGPTPQAVLAAQVATPPPPLEPLCPGVDPALVAVINRTLAKDPSARWKDGAALTRALVAPARTPLLRASLQWILVPLFVIVAAVGVWWWRRAGMVPGKPRVVVLAEFAASPVDRELAGTMRAMVGVALNQSRVVSQIAPDQLAAVRRAAGLPDTVLLTLGVARELAERAGVAAVVTGELLRSGEASTLVLRAVRTQDGADLVSVTAHADNDQDVVLAVERAARQLRRGLGERQRDLAATRPLLDVATPSLAAFRKYTDALERNRVGDQVGSNTLLREAVAIDTGFRSAWSLMAMNYMDLRLLDSAASAVSEALRDPRRLTDAQRYWLQAMAAYTVNADPAEAIRWWDLYLQEVPHSSGGRNNRALDLTMVGRWEEGRREFLRAAEEDARGPEFAVMMRLNALVSAVALGEMDQAERERSTLEGHHALFAEEVIGAARGDWARAGRAAASALADPSTPGWLRMQSVVTSASAASFGGAPDSADAILATAAASAKGVEARWYRQARLLLAVARGRALPQAPRDTMPGARMLDGVRAGLDGDIVGARASLVSLSTLDSSARRRLGHGIALVRATNAMALGDVASARALLDGPAATGELDGFNYDRPSGDLLRWVAARAALQQGDSAGAARVLAPLATSSSLPPNQVALRGLSTPYAAPLLHRHP